MTDPNTLLNPYSLLVIGKADIENIIPNDPFVVISIRNYDDDAGNEEIVSRYQEVGRDHLRQILRMTFDDVDGLKVQTMGETYSYGMTDKQGFKLAHFLKQSVQEGIRSFVFQCEAGISRSAGCAYAFEAYLKELGHETRLKSVQKLSANQWVRATLADYLKVFNGADGN